MGAKGARALTVGVAAVVATVLAVPASAARSFTTEAHWRLNEARNADLAVDSSGHHLDGSIGDDVVTGVSYGGRTGYRFPGVSSSSPPRPGHLVTVPDSNRLDPGTDTFKLVIRFRTTQSSGNIVQKGQARTYGGYWKLETHQGAASCLFRASDRTQAGVGSGQRVTDGRWHKIVCVHRPGKTKMRVDGKVTDVRRKDIGTIANGKPVTIGGKAECDQVDVGCDYFVGDIDFVRVARR